MPNDKHKSAAVPFVNPKGERSMKRVKVERYVAGKQPAYAKEDDDDEYYVTDDEQEGDEDEEEHSDDDSENDDEDDDDECDTRRAGTSRNLDHLKRESDEDSPGDNIGGDTLDSDDEDDPRFRKLRQIESKTNVSDLINIQRTQMIRPKYVSGNTNTIIDDEDDDEESIRQRHALARKRQLDEPLGLQAIIGVDRQLDLMPDDDDEDGPKQAKRLDTDDLLKDLKLTGITRPLREKHKTDAEEEAEQRKLKELLEQAKQAATFASETHKKVEEDIKRAIEREALAKGDIGAREMTSVNTDDEDEELAYEEWKLREIKRVQRYRSERMLAVTTKAR